MALLVAGLSLSAKAGSSEAFAAGTGYSTGKVDKDCDIAAGYDIHAGKVDKARNAAAIRTAIDSIAREHGIPSVAFAVVNRDSIIVSDAIGFADVENEIPATPGTVYRVGSVTKTFIALGIMHLVYEGRLDLDDRLSDIVPEIPVKNPWEDSHPVLLRHLLEHTTGFRDLYLRDFVISPGTPLPDMEYAVMREPEYWKSRWQPGTRMAYSNPGYSLLGYIIEKFSGKPYNEYLEEIILVPLGMVDSGFLGRDQSRLAVSYDRDQNPQTPLPILDHPAGYLHTTPVDMARFIRFMLLRGVIGHAGTGPDGMRHERVTGVTEREEYPFRHSGIGHGSPGFMPEELFRLMERPTSIAGAVNDMLGYGLGLYSVAARGNVGAGHDGGIDEYLSSFACFHDAGAAYYFTITSMNPQGAMAITEYLQHTLLDEVIPVSENITDHHANIEGWYRIGSYRLALAKILHDLFDPVKLEVVDDTLRMGGFSGESTNLISTGDGYHRLEESPLPTHWIGEHEGRMVISSSFDLAGGYYEQTGAFSALWKTWGLIISMLVFILCSLVCSVNYLVARIKRSRVNSGSMIWPAVGLLCFVLMIISLSSLPSLMMLGSVNIYTVAAAVFSGVFALSFVFGILSFRKGKTHKAAWKRIPLIAGYVAWAYIIVLLASYGHMPVTTWIW